MTARRGRTQRAMIAMGLATPRNAASDAPRSSRLSAKVWTATLVGAGLPALACWLLGWVSGRTAVALAIYIVLIIRIPPLISRWLSVRRARRRQ
jgi:hypothetical protein